MACRDDLTMSMSKCTAGNLWRNDVFLLIRFVYLGAGQSHSHPLDLDLLRCVFVPKERVQSVLTTRRNTVCLRAT